MKSIFATVSGAILICLLLTSAATAQMMTVTGKVTEAGTGEAMPGVNVVIKGTTQGVVSDVDGKYSIATRKGATLLFSFIGCKTVEVKVSKPVHDVTMEPSTVALEECVVVGYGVQKKESVTGSIASVQYDMAASPSARYNKVYAAYAPAQRPQNTEEYGTVIENRFKSASDDPLSTFSIDVDAASYSNMRRFVNNGEMPPKDAVRTEELVNYFSYGDARPEGKDPVRITTEVGECPWNTSHRLVRIGIKAKEMADDKLPASNFVFLIDVSGSMYGPTRLDLVKSSLKMLVNNLREKDKVAIVVYAGAAGEVLPATSGTDKQKIREALDNLTAGGSTAGGAGIQLAYKIARKNFVKDGNNRIILCTDGDFNVGVSSNKDLESLIETERKSGVFLTVLGYGMGNYKDSKMQTLAEKGNGNHAYIDNMQEANKVLVQEFGATMYTVAKDVKLQIEFNSAKVQSYRLIGYESRLLNKEDFNDDTKDAGEMGAGHTVTALYEVVPAGVKGNIPGSVDELKYQTKARPAVKADNNSPDLLTVKLRYKLPNEDKSSKMEIAVIDNGKNNVSDDFRFSAAVAMFGQLLRDSDFKGSADYAKVIALAETGLGNDTKGYRREFVRLAETVKSMSN